MTATLVARLTNIAVRVDALSLRERGILLAVTLLVVYVLADRLLLGPTLQRIEQRRTEITEMQSRLASLEARAGLMQRGDQDPLAQRRARISELETQLAAQDAQFEAQLGQLVRPDRAAPLLREVLRDVPGLRLRGLESTAGDALFADGANAGRLLQYHLSLQVDGGYFAVLDYLRRLEKLPWRLFWNEMELQVQEHPRSEVRLTLYTLGQRP